MNGLIEIRVDGKIFLRFLFLFHSTSDTNRCREQYIKFNSMFTTMDVKENWSCGR